MKIDLYSHDGKKKSDITLKKDIFGMPLNESLIKEALRYQESTSRSAIAHVKTKADVRGGGRKPFQQKGTGRARQGGIRNPHYKGGGVAFGPKSERNFAIKMPRKQRRKAILIALSHRIADKNVFALDSFDEKQVKTKDFLKLLEALPIERKVLFVSDKKNEGLAKSSKNLKNVKVILANYLNVYDLLKYDSICLLEKSLDVIEKTFSPKESNS